MKMNILTLVQIPDLDLLFNIDNTETITNGRTRLAVAERLSVITETNQSLWWTFKHLYFSNELIKNGYRK